MKKNFLCLSLFIVFLTSCAVGRSGAPDELIVSTTSESVTSTMPALFIETERVGTKKDNAHISRFRFVEINLSALLGKRTGGHNLDVGNEILLNLFPDVTYVGVIEQAQRDAGEYSWTGHLKDVDFSSLTMIYTSGIFIGQFASPEGVYEVSFAGNDLYQVVLIDQTKFPGGD